MQLINITQYLNVWINVTGIQERNMASHTQVL